MRVIIGVSVVLIATSAWGQQLYIYPQRGQSFDQQAVDKAAYSACLQGRGYTVQ